MKNFNQIKINKFLLTIFLSLLLASCGKGTFKNIGKTDSRKISPNVNERAEKNIQEGKGFRLGNLTGNQSGVFDFATSNEMWRASIELLDFTPLSNVDYSGGIIITDWFNDDSVKENIRDIKIFANENENEEEPNFREETNDDKSIPEESGRHLGVRWGSLTVPERA